jgi:flagellar basal-body rod protein FlgG
VLEGLYSAAAGMAAQQQRMDALSNDVSNVNTNGYKRLRTGFRDLVYQQAGRGAAQNVMTGSGSAAVNVGRGFAQGALRETKMPFDLAIQGQGFFAVRGENGRAALTRDGSFRVDAGGRVVTTEGAALVPPLTLPPGTDVENVRIAPDGRVTVGDAQIGRVQVVTVRSPDGLQALGDNLFAVTAASGPATPAGAGAILQGSLEASNVDLGDAMVDMMDAQRSFELASKAVQMQDQIWEVANGVKR